MDNQYKQDKAQYRIMLFFLALFIAGLIAMISITFKSKSMSYLPEVIQGQFYLVDGVEYELTSIRATNVVAHNDYIIGVSFKNDTDYFETRIENVIKGEDYKLIK